MRYGVQFQPLSCHIDAGAVRRDQKSGLDVFMTKEDVTGQVLGSAAQWLAACVDDGGTYCITDRNGIVYELSARVVTDAEPLDTCAWCTSAAAGSALHNDDRRHPSCGQPDHGTEFITQ